MSRRDVLRLHVPYSATRMQEFHDPSEFILVNLPRRYRRGEGSFPIVGILPHGLDELAAIALKKLHCCFVSVSILDGQFDDWLRRFFESVRLDLDAGHGVYDIFPDGNRSFVQIRCFDFGHFHSSNWSRRKSELG